MTSTPRSTSPARSAERVVSSSPPTDQGQSAAKPSRVEVPPDVWLQVASTGVEARLQLAQTLPLLCPTLLHPGVARSVLSSEGYPTHSLPEGSDQNSRKQLVQLMKIHAATDALLPDRAANFLADQSTYKKIGTPGTHHPREIYRLAEACVLYTTKDTQNVVGGVLAAALHFGRPNPDWRLLSIPDQWVTGDLSPNGNWACIRGSNEDDAIPFRLLDLNCAEQTVVFSGFYCGDRPSFSVGSDGLLFTDSSANKLRLNRLILKEGALSVKSQLTTFSSERDAALVVFSPQGLRALVGNQSGANVYRIDERYPPTTFAEGDLDDEYKKLIWSQDETRLCFFYPDSRRATSFSLDHPTALKQTFRSDLAVQSCYDRHLLTVRTQDAQEIWQLFNWDGKEVSAPATLPQGRRNHEDHSKLVGFRALLAQDRHPNILEGTRYFVDFAANEIRPLLLTRDYSFTLGGDLNGDRAWLVGTPVRNQETDYALVNTGCTGGTAGNTVHLPRKYGDEFRIRADGQAMFIGRPGVGLLAHRLAPGK